MIAGIPSATAKIGVINCIGGPVELGGWIQEQFTATLGTLSGVPGVREFYLRRSLSTDLTSCLYLSITVWDTISDFDRWQASPAFERAHPDRTRYRKEFEQLRQARLKPDMAVYPTTTIADLDAAIITRLRAEHPDLIASHNSFMPQLHWEPGQLPNLEYLPTARIGPTAGARAPR